MDTRLFKVVLLIPILLGIPTVCCHLAAPSLREREVYGISCEEGWLKLCDNCYIVPEINTHGKTYWEARGVCKDYHSTLISIHSEEEQEFVSSLQKNKEIWIGLTTKDTQRKNFKWDDGSAVTYDNLSSTSYKSVPVTTVNDYCFYINTKKDREWSSGDCDQRRLFVCKKLGEITLNDLESLQFKKRNKSRPRRSNWFRRRHTNSRPISHRDEITPSLPWRTPKDILHHQDSWNMDDDSFNVLHPWIPESSPTSSHLQEVSFFPLGNHGRFSSPFQSTFSNTFLQPDGLARHHQENQEFHQRTNKVYPAQFSDTPTHRLGSFLREMAIQTSKQLSGDADSNNYFPSLQVTYGSIGAATTSSSDSVERDSNVPSKALTIGTRCQENDLSFSGSCYSISNDTKSYNEAYVACEKEKAYLVVINNNEEQLFLSQLLVNMSIPVWIGLRQKQNVSSGNSLQWVDGSSLDDSFQKFIGKDLLSESCVAVSNNLTETESWVSKECSENNFSYICEYEPLAPLSVNEGCLEGWEQADHRCYKVFPKPASWNDSESHCQVFGGHLASSGSTQEEDILRRLSQNSQVSDFFSLLWVGLQLDSESNYKWTDGSPLGYLNWAEDQPDFHGELDHCGSATRKGFRIHDSPCDAFLPFICEAAEDKMLNIEQLPQTKPDKVCEDDPSWLLYADHCYKIFSSRDDDWNTWLMSRQLCREIGGELASIHSVEENYWLQSQVYNLSDTVLWIGGYSYMDSGYQWADGTPFDFSNWAKGEPNNNYDQEDCVSFYTHNFGYWNDQNCAHGQGRVCKRPLGATHPPPVITPPPEGNCPSGWMHAGAKCLKFVKEKVTFDEARKACKDLDHTSDLVSISSPKEQAYLTAALGELKVNTWIGLRHESGYHWTDQSALTYTNWARGEPSSGGWMDPMHRENCVGLLTYNLAGQWNNVYCNALLSYVCQKRPDPDLPNSDPLPACVSPYENYFNYSGSCYRPESSPKTREEAEDICISEGGHLASAVTKTETSWLWVLTQQHDLDDPWIGLSKNKDNVFEWSDNWPTIFTRWGPGEPNVTLPDNNCVRLNSQDGLWYTGNCSEARAFICKQSSEAFPTPDPPTGGTCPSPQWLDFGGSFCYLISTEESPWEDANKRCALKGSNLTSIHSLAEMSLLVQAAHKIPDPMWIGLVQMKDGFGWSDGTGYEFVNWQDGEPNSEGEECTEMYPGTGLWNDAICSNARPFICKIAKKGGKLTLENMGRPAELTGKDSPSPGAIAGIVIPVLLIVTGLAAFFFYQNKKKPKPLGNSGAFGFDNAVYSEDTESHLDLETLPQEYQEEEEEIETVEEQYENTEEETKIELRDEESDSDN